MSGRGAAAEEWGSAAPRHAQQSHRGRQGEGQWFDDDGGDDMTCLSKVNPDMTEEIMYKTCVQFFGDGYGSASEVH